MLMLKIWRYNLPIFDWNQNVTYNYYRPYYIYIYIKYGWVGFFFGWKSHNPILDPIIWFLKDLICDQLFLPLRVANGPSCRSSQFFWVTRHPKTGEIIRSIRRTTNMVLLDLSTNKILLFMQMWHHLRIFIFYSLC